MTRSDADCGRAGRWLRRLGKLFAPAGAAVDPMRDALAAAERKAQQGAPAQGGK